MTTTRRTADARDRVLERVRALLAKAESTDFAEEAAALSAKAYELIATYAIDLALIEEQEGRGEVVTTTIFIEAPYAKEKFLLLSGVARGNRCRAVLGIERDLRQELIGSDELPHYSNGKLATVVGYRSDIDSVELLFTSLLLQAVNTMLARGSVVEPWGENRTRSFRRSFLASFAWTVRERFEEIERITAANADADGLGTVLPVLADRRSEVERTLETRFPDLTTLRTSISNHDGVIAGESAGRRADIGTDSLHGRPPTLSPAPRPSPP